MRFWRRIQIRSQSLVRPLPILFAVMSLLLSGTISRPQTPIPALARPSVPESQWKAKLNANTVSIVAGGPGETYLDITNDLAVVLNDDNLRVVPIVGMGGAQNIRDVLYLRGVDAGITSSHMLRYFASTGELGTDLNQRLTYITRLFQEEVHIVAGPAIEKLEDLGGKSVNFSEPGSSAQVTAREVFGLLSIAVAEVNLSQADAIAKLRTGEIAATVIISGKPTEMLSRISHGDNLHLLEVPYTRSLQNNYVPAQLESTIYPNLITDGQSVQTIAVDAVLITNNWFPAGERYRRIATFVDSFFSRFGELRKPPRHPKWQEVNLSAELPGWQRFAEAQNWLDGAEPPKTARKNDRFDEPQSRKQSKGDSALPDAEKQRFFQKFLEWSAGTVKK